MLVRRVPEPLTPDAEVIVNCTKYRCDAQAVECAMNLPRLLFSSMTRLFRLSFRVSHFKFGIFSMMVPIIALFSLFGRVVMLNVVFVPSRLLSFLQFCCFFVVLVGHDVLQELELVLGQVIQLCLNLVNERVIVSLDVFPLAL